MSAGRVALARVAQAQALLRSADLYVDALDASSITLVGSKVSAWANKGTASVNLVQTTDSRRPSYGTRTFNGRPVLEFKRASNRALDAGDVLDLRQGSMTLFAVSAFDEASGNGSIIAKASNLGVTGHWALVRDTTTLFAGSAFGITGQIQATSYTTTALTVLSQQITRTGVGSTNILTRDATVIGSTTYGVDALDHQQALSLLVGNYGAAGYAFEGCVGMVAVFLRALTAYEMETVRWYLRMVWGTA